MAMRGMSQRASMPMAMANLPHPPMATRTMILPTPSLTRRALQ